MRMSLLIAALMMTAAPLHAQSIDAKTQARLDRILKATPLIDGHNDLPWELRENYGGRVENLASGTDRLEKPLMTDIARLRAGRVGGQFWSVYIPADVTGPAAIQMTIEQIDVVKRLVAAYPRDLEFATTAAEIVRIHRAGRIASLIGMEGGHHIANNLAALRAFHDLGARYMTITHFDNNDWADAATADPKHNGLTAFGRTVIGEMNRIGMLADLSHVSEKTMTDIIAVTRAPVIFSHSNARAIQDHPRNVSDAVLRLLPANGGVVMVNFYPGYLSEDVRARGSARAAEEARLKALFVGQPNKLKAGLDAWDAAHPVPPVPLSVVADHIDHIAKVAGHDHVGLGGDLDGVPSTAVGLEDVAGYPRLCAELIRRGWSDANLAKLAGGNILRALRGAEATAAAMKNQPPSLEALMK
jgi:membrane dipeptidase